MVEILIVGGSFVHVPMNKRDVICAIGREIFFCSSFGRAAVLLVELTLKIPSPLNGNPEGTYSH